MVISKNFHLRMIRLPATLLYILVVLTISSCKGEESDDAVAPDNDPEELVTVFERREAGYDLFRIPAIIRSKDGTLLAFAEARKKSSSGDTGDIDLVVKRSTDDGKTWGSMITVWSDGENTSGNPAPVVDQQTGVIHLLMTWNNGSDNYSAISNGTGKDTRRVFVTSSEDDGVRWAAAKEITSAVKLPEWRWYGTGPVHGVQITEGAHANRMVIPCYYSVMDNGSRKDFSHIIYSDDHGATWSLGGSTPQDKVGESTVAVLPGGKLLLNMRSSNLNYRIVSTSDDGGGSWSAITVDNVLIDPKCQGSILSHQQPNTFVVLFANAASSARENMTIKMSYDNGGTWTKKYNVHAGASAYSDIVMLSDDEVGIVFETGGSSPYGNIVFKRIALGEFK